MIVGFSIVAFSCDNDTAKETTSSKTNTTAALAVTPKKFLFDALYQILQFFFGNIFSFGLVKN